MRSFDVLVVGAGPAGMAAAWAASSPSRRVGVIDDNPGAGGQIWRGERSSHWFTRFSTCGAELLNGKRVLARAGPQKLLTEAGEIEFAKLILCTGARERFLPFPGWTLPGVMGVGGLQAMAKGGMPVHGKRIVVAGTGPLLLAVAVYLKSNGARVLRVAEQAPFAKARGFAKALLREPGKLARGLRLLAAPVRFSSWPLRAEGTEKLESVTLHPGPRRIACDYLACGFGLVPNTELAALLECRIDTGVVAIDRWQQTTQPGIFAAGEITGIGGVDAALIEGQIAGYATTDNRTKAEKLFKARDRALRFRRAMETAFALRHELGALADADTIVCRCEGVTLGRLQDQRSWRSAKLQTRCGMGPCQGRVCGPAVAHLLGWPAESVRPPLFPTAAANLARDV
jgi:NADPH-dependent 2,4-dienoyl-CoA reductase/sulfur reductase-like enzyme